MNLRQVKKREKRLNNEYWDRFEQILGVEERFIQIIRSNELQDQEFGECAVLTFQLESLESWQGVAVLKDSEVLTVYLQPTDWLEELNIETCFFQWTAAANEFQLKDWTKWVKPVKQAPLKAKVQAITLKKRMSEKQAQEWWETYEKEEQLAAERNQEVLHEIQDYVRMLPYQISEIMSVEVNSPIQIRTETHWRTFPVYQIQLKLTFKEEVSEKKQTEILEICQTQLKDEIFRSRSYEYLVIK